MVFYETTKLEGSDSHTGGSGVADGPPPAFHLGIGMMPQPARVELGRDISDTEMQPANPGPSAHFNAPFEDEPEFGWCQIVEE